MGNCQAAEEAVVVVQHPGDGNVRVDRMYWSISANEVMSSNPGHYVALVIPYNSSSSSNNTDNHNIQPSLKLLRPTDTLHLGHVYRLITFEDVIKEFATKKKSVKLGKLLEASGTVTLHNTDKSGAARSKLDHNQWVFV
ncbi:Large tegument protein deneddylase [Bienertia sinuspersici]